MTRVTVCELRDDREGLRHDWAALVGHVQAAESDLVLLPEMPFHPWLARVDDVKPDAWDSAMASHKAWLLRVAELGAAVVVGTQPVVRNGLRLNQGFAWTREAGVVAGHEKAFLPDEAGFWEASWYDRGPGEFSVLEVHGIRIGFLICTELWFNAYARLYAAQGIHLLVVPRATPASSVDKWVAGGRTAAVVAGAFCVSSNRGGDDGAGMAWGGAGWVIGPDGEVMGVTNQDQPFRTIDVDLTMADAAKLTYPRYVPDLACP